MVNATETATQDDRQGLASFKDFAKGLRTNTLACRLKRKRWGIRLALANNQKAEVAEHFHAEEKSINASKKLVDSKHPAMRAVLKLMSEITQYWTHNTIEFPDKGTRLLKKSKLELFEERMREYDKELSAALKTLNEALPELKTQAQADLGDLFNAGDYPESVTFRIEWDYPTVAVPEYLKEQNLALYEREVQKLEAQFAQSVADHEQTMATELANMVAGLLDRLEPGDGGKAKIVRSSHVENFTEFFARFSEMNLGSNPALEAAVSEAQKAMTGVDIKSLRKDDMLRDSVKAAMGGVSKVLDTLLVDKPTRAFDFEAME